VHDKDLLVVCVVVGAALLGATQAVNYAIFCTLVATLVLIGLDFGKPLNLTDNWQRVAWTVAGAAIGLAVLLLAGLAAKGSRPKGESEARPVARPVIAKT
jgi:hypothetical protein